MKKYLSERRIEDIDPDNIDNTWDDLLWKGYQMWVKHSTRIKKSIDADPYYGDLTKVDYNRIICQRMDLLIYETIQKYPDWSNRAVAEFIEIPIRLVMDVKKSVDMNQAFFED